MTSTIPHSGDKTWTCDDDVRVSVDISTSTTAAAPSNELPYSLVEEMEGTLDVEPDGDGTQFTLTLPRSSVPSGNGPSSILSSESSTG